MNVLISGSSGLVGRTLTTELESAGHRVVRLVRKRSHVGEAACFWNPESSEIAEGAMDGIDAIVHLAGANLLSGRWTKGLKRRFHKSRVGGAALLAYAAAGASSKPAVIVSASAVGYYGNTGSLAADEDRPKGSGFLADLCSDWEDAWAPARDAGIRVVNARIGLVLEYLLGKLVPVFRFGLGGRVGSGAQWMSWIALGDLVRIIETALRDDRCSGPVNAAAPGAVTNRELTEALARVLHRPAVLPVPAFALRMLLGREMADETALADIRAVPGKLADLGFHFEHPELEPAIRAIVDR